MPEAYAIFLNKELCLMVNSFQKIKMHVKKRRFDGRNSGSTIAHILQLCHGVIVKDVPAAPRIFFTLKNFKWFVFCAVKKTELWVAVALGPII